MAKDHATMSPKDFEHFERIAAEVKAVLDKHQMIMLAEYVRQFNAGQKKSRLKYRLSFPSAAQACREGRIPGVQLAGRHWLVPVGAIDAAREAGVLTGVRGRPANRKIITGTCPACGKDDLKGTQKGLTVKHLGPDGLTCEGHGQPLLNPTVEKVE